MTSGVLLDTHALVWLALGETSLGRRGRAMIDDALKDDAVYVSAISFFEIATLCRRGRLQLYAAIEVWRQRVLQQGIIEIPVQGDVAIAAADLDGLPGDPADRLITAAALSRGYTLVTADERILGWAGTLLRHDARR